MQLDVAAARKPARISLTPLIDVVFILLLFFMLSSSFMQWRQLDLPIPSAVQGESKEVIVVHLLDNEGSIAIGDDRLSLGQPGRLSARLSELVSAQPGIYGIDVAEGVNTQSLVRLVDALKLAGAHNVSLGGVLP